MMPTKCPICDNPIQMAHAPKIGSTVPRDFVGKPGIPMIIEPCKHLVLIRP